ncbi:MAG: ABC transporter permease, partial [Chloroflexota bacterium]
AAPGPPRGRGPGPAGDGRPALPLLVLAQLLLVLPTIVVVLQSFRGEAGGLTLANWAETLGRKSDRRAILTSLQLGALCGTVSLLIGAPLAWAISRALPAARTAWLSLLNVGANFGGIGLAFAYTAVLGTYGMVTLAVQRFGLPFTPPSSTSFTGLALAYLYTNIPLFILLTLPAMHTVRDDWMEAAEVCSATRAQFWQHVGIPVLAPFLLAGWVLIFTWTVGIYGLAYALAGSAPAAPVRLMTLQIGIALNQSANGQQRAAVMAAILLIIAAVSLLTYRLILRRATRWFT